MAMKSKYALCLVFLTAFFFSAAAQKFEQTGYATYYSSAFQGRHTSCGEIFDNAKYTAAHATLPFQTLVKVTNLKSNKYVIVKINDRCPKYYNRIIDLSQAAARALDIIAAGVANVKLEVISESELNYVPVDDTTMQEKDLADTSSLKNRYAKSEKRNTFWQEFNFGDMFSMNKEAVIIRNCAVIEKGRKTKDSRDVRKEEKDF